MKIIKQHRIYRQDLKNNPDVLYLFGDNLVQKGFGGQAKEMRGEPNAIGIPTKKLPSMGSNSFFTDEEYLTNCEAIDKAFNRIKDAEVVVIPSDGLGTGLAMLDTKAPKTFAYLNKCLQKLHFK